MESIVAGLCVKDGKVRAENLADLLEKLEKGLLPDGDVSDLCACLAANTSDNNVKVCACACQCIERLCETVHEEVRPHAETLTDPLVEVLGNAKPQIREKASTALVALMAAAGATSVLQRMCAKSFSHKNWRVKEGTFDCYSRQIVSFSGGGRAAVAADALLNNVAIVSLADGQPDLRRAATDAYAHLAVQIGLQRVITKISAHPDIRPAHVKTVKDKYAELASEEGTGGGNSGAGGAGVGMTTTTTTMRPKLTPIEAEAASLSERGFTASSASSLSSSHAPLSSTSSHTEKFHIDTTTTSRGGGSGTPSLLDDATILVHPAMQSLSQFHAAPWWKPGIIGDAGFVNDSFTAKPITSCTTPRDLSKCIETLCSVCANTTADWKARSAAIDTFRGLITGGVASSIDGFASIIPRLRDPLVIQVQDLRSSIVKLACLAVSELSASLGQTQWFEPLADLLVETLMKQTYVTIAVIATSAHATICTILHNTKIGFHKVIPKLLAGAKTKSPVLRARCAEYLLIVLRGWSPSVLERYAQDLQVVLTALLTDADPTARQCARIAYWSFASVFPGRCDAVLSRLDGATHRFLQDDHETARGTAFEAAKSNPMPVTSLISASGSASSLLGGTSSSTSGFSSLSSTGSSSHTNNNNNNENTGGGFGTRTSNTTTTSTTNAKLSVGARQQPQSNSNATSMSGTSRPSSSSSSSSAATNNTTKPTTKVNIQRYMDVGLDDSHYSTGSTGNNDADELERQHQQHVYNSRTYGQQAQSQPQQQQQYFEAADILKQTTQTNTSSNSTKTATPPRITALAAPKDRGSVSAANSNTAYYTSTISGSGANSPTKGGSGGGNARNGGGALSSSSLPPAGAFSNGLTAISIASHPSTGGGNGDDDEYGYTGGGGGNGESALQSPSALLSAAASAVLNGTADARGLRQRFLNFVATCVACKALDARAVVRSYVYNDRLPRELLSTFPASALGEAAITMSSSSGGNNTSLSSSSSPSAGTSSHYSFTPFHSNHLSVEAIKALSALVNDGTILRLIAACAASGHDPIVQDGFSLFSALVDTYVDISLLASSKNTSDGDGADISRIALGNAVEEGTIATITSSLLNNIGGNSGSGSSNNNNNAIVTASAATNAILASLPILMHSLFFPATSSNSGGGYANIHNNNNHSTSPRTIILAPIYARGLVQGLDGSNTKKQQQQQGGGGNGGDEDGLISPSAPQQQGIVCDPFRAVFREVMRLTREGNGGGSAITVPVAKRALAVMRRVIPIHTLMAMTTAVVLTDSTPRLQAAALYLIRDMFGDAGGCEYFISSEARLGRLLNKIGDMLVAAAAATTASAGSVARALDPNNASSPFFRLPLLVDQVLLSMYTAQGGASSLLPPPSYVYASSSSSSSQQQQHSLLATCLAKLTPESVRAIVDACDASCGGSIPGLAEAVTRAKLGNGQGGGLAAALLAYSNSSSGSVGALAASAAAATTAASPRTLNRASLLDLADVPAVPSLLSRADSSGGYQTQYPSANTNKGGENVITSVGAPSSVVKISTTTTRPGGITMGSGGGNTNTTSSSSSFAPPALPFTNAQQGYASSASSQPVVARLPATTAAVSAATTSAPSSSSNTTTTTTSTSSSSHVISLTRANLELVLDTLASVDNAKQLRALHYFGRAVDLQPPPTGAAPVAAPVLHPDASTLQLPPLHRDDPMWLSLFDRVITAVLSCIAVNNNNTSSNSIRPSTSSSPSTSASPNGKARSNGQQQQQLPPADPIVMSQTALSVLRKLFRNCTPYVVAKSGTSLTAVFRAVRTAPRELASVLERTAEEIIDRLPLEMAWPHLVAALAEEVEISSNGGSGSGSTGGFENFTTATTSNGNTGAAMISCLRVTSRLIPRLPSGLILSELNKGRIMDALRRSFLSTSSDVRRAVVGVLVELHMSLRGNGGGAFARYAEQYLTAPQQKLLQMYIEKAADERQRAQ